MFLTMVLAKEQKNQLQYNTLKACKRKHGKQLKCFKDYPIKQNRKISQRITDVIEDKELRLELEKANCLR